MKRILIGLSVLVSVPAFASAQAHYDLKLEEAVKAVIAGKIGEIRPGFKYGQTFSADATSTGRASSPAPSRRLENKSWRVVGGDTTLTQTSSGSFQTFSDGAVITPKQRHVWANRTVSRVINF